jgi:predicted PurR-regulated permease PerM
VTDRVVSVRRHLRSRRSRPPPGADRAARDEARLRRAAPRRGGTGEYRVRSGLLTAAGYSWRLIVVAAAVYLVFVVLGRLHFPAIAVFVGLLITALLRPLTDLLAGWVPRGVAVAVALVQAVVVVGGLITWVIASVVGQSGALVEQFVAGLTDIERFAADPPFGLPPLDLTGMGSTAATWLSENRAVLVGQAIGGAGRAVELFTGLALAVFCAVFFLHSGERMWAWLLDQVPGDRARWDAAARAGWTTFAGYTRGIMLVASSNAALVFVVLLALRVPLALPLAVLVLLGGFVPLIGAPIALWVATLVALAARGPWIALAVLVLIVLIGQVEGHVLHPVIMSRAVKLHPVAIALAVASGPVLAGIIGAVVAVPLVAVAWAISVELRAVPPAPQGRAASPVPRPGSRPAR